MSYCVNCGVELADSEKKCPLCGTVVLNPKQEKNENIALPYSDKHEDIVKNFDARFGAWLAAMILLIPCGISVICNLTVNHELSWSLYVVGACICVFVLVLTPLLLRGKFPYLLILLDGAALTLYLLLIGINNNGEDWFLPLALPIVLSTLAAALASTAVIKRQNTPVIYKIAFSLLFAGTYCILLEIIIDLAVCGKIDLMWSLIVMLVCVVFSVIMFIIERRKRLKEEIRRKLFI